MTIDLDTIRRILLASWANADCFPNDREEAFAYLVASLDAYLVERGAALVLEITKLQGVSDHAAVGRLDELLAEIREAFARRLDATIKCEKCGKRYGVGEEYRCPHGPVSRGGVIDDTLPGGARWMHNLGDHPVWVETKTQYREELSSRGLQQAERGSYNRDDKSPYATRTRLRPGARDPFLR